MTSDLLYPSASAWHAAPRKNILLFGMSGLGKTHIAKMLRASGDWFHYSVDYRIGTRYMGEYIVDNFKREAMRNPFLAQLLRTDSIYIASNLTFDNLDPLSTYLGKPGDPRQGGLEIGEYTRRQQQHHEAEVEALRDTVRFIDRARDIYDYQHFVCDSGGSICEVISPDDPQDPLLQLLSRHMLMIGIEGGPDHRDTLIARFNANPKPMCYSLPFLQRCWDSYIAETGCAPDQVDPDAFIRWAYAQALDYRAPRYQAMAKWGITVTADQISSVTGVKDFLKLIEDGLEARTTAA